MRIDRIDAPRSPLRATAGRGSGDGAEVGAGPRGPVVKPTRDGASFVSAPLRGSMPFTHVGLHWATVTPGGADPTFELRSGSDGVTWTDWQAVAVERSPEDTRVGVLRTHDLQADRHAVAGEPGAHRAGR